MEMNWGTLIKEIGRGPHGARDLDEEDAHRMFAAMLDGAVPELELGGIMIALRIKGESVAELRGFQRAAAERMQRLVGARRRAAAGGAAELQRRAPPAQPAAAACAAACARRLSGADPRRAR